MNVPYLFFGVIYSVRCMFAVIKVILCAGIIFKFFTDYVFHNNLGIVVGAKYTYANLIGKEFKDDTGTKYNLNDGEHTSNGVNYPEKKVRYIHFYGGLSFYFGR